jgi:hypothetical protein
VAELLGGPGGAGELGWAQVNPSQVSSKVGEPGRLLQDHLYPAFHRSSLMMPETVPFAQCARADE